ncbi:MAG: hypothetical protein ABFE01_29760 [Phycisphaerales bacterium]
MILGLAWATAGAQVDVNETGLHDGESVYGVEMPTTPDPYVTLEPITLFAWGETDPNLHAETMFSAYGIYGVHEDAVHLVNSGAVDVHASGGMSYGPGAMAHILNASGIYVSGDVDNTGDIAVSAVGGTADACEGIGYAGINAAYGLFAEFDVNNAGDITIYAAAGTTDANTLADAQIDVAGLHAGGDVNNVGNINVAAQGGRATVNPDSFQGMALADVEAVGLYAGADANNAGGITVTAIAGTAEATGVTTATAITTGLYGYEAVVNAGDVSVTAVGGTATTVEGNVAAFARATGLFAYHDITNTGDIDIIAMGGTIEKQDGAGTPEAYAQAMGIELAGDVSNTGDIRILARGGTAAVAGPSGSLYSHADAYGIRADHGDATNTGVIDVNSVGGSANAADVDASVNADANAYGIYAPHGLIDNRGQIKVRASGGTTLSQSTSSMIDTSASGRAHGLYSLDGAIDNTADVNVVARGGSATGTATDTQHEIFAAAWAYGIQSADAPIVNSGSIIAVATGGHASSTSNDVDDPGAYARAIAQGIDSGDGDVSNSGNMTVSATGGTAASQGAAYASADAEATAFDASRDLQTLELIQVQNTGALVVEAIGGQADSTSGDASSLATAIGFLTPFADVTNTADVSVTAQGGIALATRHTSAWSTAYGMYSEGGRIDNSGNITVTSIGGTAMTTDLDDYIGADASVYTRGIAAEAMLNNTGSVTVNITGGTATGRYSAQANASGYGLRTFGTLTNSGDVLLTATGGTVASSYAIAMVDVTGLSSVAVNNTGAVTVIATGGTATGDNIADASVRATGIGGSPLVNSGAVSVTAIGGTTNGTDNRGDVFAVGIGAAGDVQNSGDVTVTAIAAEGSASQAYGIWVDAPANVSNTGIIRVTGDTAYELSIASGSTTLVDTYNVTLDGDPNRASIGVADGATLALNDATLTVTAVDGETLWNTEYKLFEVEGTGAVDGNFADVRAVNPNTAATYHDQGTAGSADDTVSLAYSPGGSSALASAAVEKQAVSLATDVVNLHMTTSMLQNILSPSTSGLLADSGSTAESLALTEAASDKSAGIYLEPYYSLVDKDANPLGYDARLWGFSAGYERFLGATLLGLHAGFGKADIDYTGAGYRGNSEEQDIATAGFSGLTRWDPWLLRYGLTGFYGGHDYFGLTGLNLDEHETASYDSYGAATTLMIGRIFHVRSHILLPEAGLNWLWTHRQRYTTDATDPAWDTTYSAMDDHDLYAAAAIRWLSTFTHDEVRVSPSAAVGVRHLLTDDEADAWQSIPGAAPALVRSEQDRTAMTLSGSLTLTGDEHALSLAYDGEYSPDFQRHNLWLRYSWLF